jgi:glycosyltransferase involved in cell wall biosynthesis
LRILFVSSVLLFRHTRHGGSKRFYYFARELAKKHDLHIVCLDGSKERQQFKASEKDFEKFLMLDYQEYRSWGRMCHVSIDIRASLRRHKRAFLEFCGGQSFDAVILAYPIALSFLHCNFFPRAVPVFYAEDDLVFEKARQEILHSGNVLTALFKRFRYRQTVSYYRLCLRYLKKFITISPQESAVIHDIFPEVDAPVVSYGIDCAEYPFLPLPQENTIGFVVNFNHPPNRDALVFLLDSVYPCIKKEFPGLRLFVAGKSIPPDCVQKYPAASGIVWQENVTDLRDFYKNIVLFVNPVVSGRGMRTKVIEAAAFGRPVVSTALGAEGLKQLAISTAETPDEFLTACRKFFNNCAYAGQVAAENRRVVENQFALSLVAGQLEKIITQDL